MKLPGKILSRRKFVASALVGGLVAPFVKPERVEASHFIQAEPPTDGLVIPGMNPQGLVPQGGGDPVPGGPGFVTLSGGDFQPFLQTTSWGRDGVSLFNKSGGPAEFIAPLKLPQNAVINQMVVYYFDANTTHNIRVLLLTGSLFTQNPTILGDISSTDAAPSGYRYVAVPIPPTTVDNSKSWYLADLLLPPALDVKLNGVRIDYGFPVSLPMIQK